MAGLGKSRGSKSTSGSKSVKDRIKDAREMGMNGNRSKKKSTATSETKKNYGGAKPQRVDRAKRTELIAKRREAQGERTQGRRVRTPEQEAVAQRLRERIEKKRGNNPKPGRRPEDEGGSGRRPRPGGPGLKGRGPKRPGNDVVNTTPADRGRGPRPGGNQIDNRGPKTSPRGPGQTGGNVGPGGRGPTRTPGGRDAKEAIGRGGKGGGGNGRGPKAGGNQIDNRGPKRNPRGPGQTGGNVGPGGRGPSRTPGTGTKPGRGQGPKRSPGQTGGNVGPGGAGPNRTGGFDTVYFM